MTINLAKVGEALYGARWQTDLAKDLDVSDRTIRRWIVEPTSIPSGAWLDMLRLTQERAAILGDLAEGLKSQAAP